ncbi:MAG: ATP-binding protein [Azospirillaceae bacterium]
MLATASVDEVRATLEAFGAPAAMIEVASGGNHRYIAVNKRAQALVGFGDNDVHGGRPGQFMPQDNVRRALVFLNRCIDSRAPVEYDDVYPVRGRQLHVRRTYAPIFSDDGRVVRIMVTLTDITDQVRKARELHESEQRFRDFTQAASDSFWETNAEGRMVLVRGRAGDRPSLPFAEQIGRTPGEVISDAGAVCEDPRDLDGLMAQHLPIKAYVYSRTLPNGDKVWRELDGRPYFDEQGQFRGYRGVSRDITTRKRAEAALRSAKDQAEQANAAKSRFLAAATHDLRQPLQAAVMLQSVLARCPLPTETRDAVAKLGRSLECLQDMLTRLLDMSRLDAGVVVPEPVTFELDDLFDRLAEVYIPQAAARGLEFRVRPSHLRVVSDPHLLHRVLDNLVANAVKYTEAGGVLIGARQRGEALRIQVWDTGVGIPSESLKIVFEEFRQLDSASRDPQRGLGIGLSIVEGLARLLRHPVSVRSTVGKGTVFEIDVPLADAAGTRRLPPIAADTPVGDAIAAAVGREAAGGRIALIDNDRAVLEALALSLEAAGYDVVAAPDMDELVSRLSEGRRPPDLLIADFNLGGGADGGSAIRTVQERLGLRSPAILLTGDTTPERLKAAQRSGFVVLHKPVLPDELGRRIAELVG